MIVYEPHGSVDGKQPHFAVGSLAVDFKEMVPKGVSHRSLHSLPQILTHSDHRRGRVSTRHDESTGTVHCAVRNTIRLAEEPKTHNNGPHTVTEPLSVGRVAWDGSESSSNVLDKSILV